MTDQVNPVLLDPAIDKDAIRARYADERDKRVRADGVGQYQRLEGRLGDLGVDPWLPVAEREPVTDDVTFAFIGGGFSGLSAGARLKEAGVDDVRIVDAGGDFGGVWYWNRYPGAMCDTASLVYLPLLEETGHVPTEKYVHGPEILEHCRRIGKHFGLYDRALFHTTVSALTWDEQASRWIVETNRGDRFTARFVGMGLGPLSVPKLPGIPGIETFAGHSMHTSRWDYAYTGGDPGGSPLDGLRGKRVGVIGTGATAVQLVPELAEDAGELFVFQRTPSSINVRNNGPLDEETKRAMERPGWQKEWLANFTLNWEGFSGLPAPGVDVPDLVRDGWTDIGRRMRAQIHSVPPEQMSPEAVLAAVEELDIHLMERLRERVDEIVDDPQTAEALKPWYQLFCKRPCFHDDYLPAFNRPHVHMVDTAGRGVERITPAGVVVAGEEYPLDCLVYASGFEYGTDYLARAGYDVTGRDGVRLSEAWADGMRTLHGMHVHGFPNMLIVQLPQGAFLGSNVPHGFDESAETIAAIVATALAEGVDELEVTQQAQDGWVEMLLRDGQAVGNAACTPGYYNNEGHPSGLEFELSVGDPRGPTAFFAMVDEWRRAAVFPEFERRRSGGAPLTSS